MKVLFVTTVPQTLLFSKEYVLQLKKQGAECILMSSSEKKLSQIAQDWNLPYKFIPFYRGMNPFSDLKVIIKMYEALKSIKPDVIVAATPKAAMISMVAGKLTGIKTRIYHIYGLPFETVSGIKKRLLLGIEKMTGLFATGIIPIGSSVREVVENLKLFKNSKIIQEGLLTTGGVDLDRFNAESLKPHRTNIREELKIKDSDIVIGYVARLTRDKGFVDITEIWDKIKTNSRLHLLIAGGIDSRCPVPGHLLERFLRAERVHYVGCVDDVEKYFAAMDIFLFPSYREGFGNVNLEAAAMEIPVLTYDVTGCRDAVSNNENGFVVPFRKYEDLIEKLESLIKNPTLRVSLGKNGRKLVERHFSRKKVSENFIQSLSLIISKERVSK